MLPPDDADVGYDWRQRLRSGGDVDDADEATSEVLLRRRSVAGRSRGSRTVDRHPPLRRPRGDRHRLRHRRHRYRRWSTRLRNRGVYPERDPTTP